MPDFTLSQFASKDDMYKAMQAEIDQLQAQLTCQGCAVQQGYVPVETLSAEIAEPKSRFCPECGHVGEIGTKHRDCCPDGSHAFMVPARWASELREGFKARFGNTEQAQHAAAAQPPEACPSHRPAAATSVVSPEVSTDVPEKPSTCAACTGVGTLCSASKPKSVPEPVQLPDFLRKLRISAKRDGELGRDSGRTDEIEQRVHQLFEAQNFQLDELAMLTRKLVQKLRQAAPGNESAEKALDYLKRKGLAGNPLRATQEQSNGQ